MKMLDVLMQWGWIESGISYTNRPALNGLVLLLRCDGSFLISSSHSTDDIHLVLMETGRCSASPWSKTLCLSGVSIWGPFKEQKPQVGRGGFSTNPRSQHLDQPPYLWWHKAPSLLLVPFPLPSDSDSESALLGVSGKCGSQTTLRVLQSSYSSCCNAQKRS